jgi:ketosteroid isomerase-like protein
VTTILDRMDDERQLLDRWAGWQRAIERRDVEAAKAFLADDFALELVQPRRVVVRRQEWLATLADYNISAYAVLDQIVDIAGDIAVILHREEMTAIVLGEDRSGAFVLTDVWRRQDGEWRIWRRHSTPLSAGAMPRS